MVEDYSKRGIIFWVYNHHIRANLKLLSKSSKFEEMARKKNFFKCPR